ncbi:MAG TPA: alpha-(1-_3)-arabinofuranosyltransferase family protein, partial [Acidimicrobiia bacterium]|nr:alpha-(1->3)-arabinofuranosyltransferase family protein [Acidimicrobiia bacterium]
MVATSERGTRRRAAPARALDVVVLALLAYVPFFFSSPGRLSSDTKQNLYLDPGRLLARAPYLWDPHIGAGTVPHQQIGYLYPMGPFYWLMDRAGVPDWIAQRFWLGTISLAAVLGARWLFLMLGTKRVGALVGALAYLLTPYQLAFTARISVLLLPWAALPWLVGLTMRAARRGGWRDPAIFALIVVTVGGVNASSLLLIALGPILWLVFECTRGRAAAHAAGAAGARIAVASIGVSLWWVIGLRLQGRYGLPVLQLTENLRTVANDSAPADLLRGIGNWFFYGQDSLGYSLDQAAAYASSRAVVTASFAVPILGLLGAAVLRWRHRAYFAALVVVGVVVGAGAWPYDDPSPYGEAWKQFANDNSIGLALRNTPRVAPLIVLGLAALLAAFVDALAVRRVLQVGAASFLVVVLAIGFLPVWRHGYLSEATLRPEEIPSYWIDAIDALDREGHDTRILEIPGSSFSAYRWGNTVEPVTPGLTDRPYVAREVLPYGSAPSVNLLDALDRRMQIGTFEPDSLAPVARLLGVGTVVLRADLDTDRFGAPAPRELWVELTEPLAPGLDPPESFGPRVATSTADGAAASAAPPAVALFPVQDAVPIVHAAPVMDPVLLSGDGDGIVDAAAAGLLSGREQVLELAALDPSGLQAALDDGAALVLTDSNRRRVQNWFSSLSETRGATEQAGRTANDPNEYDFRLNPFPDGTDANRTVVEQRGGNVEATSDGGAARPEDRAVGAFDGDLATSWRVGGADPRGESITLRTERPVRADEITLVQPQDGPRDRLLTRVRLRFDSGPPVTVELGPDSLTPEGQVVRFPARTIRQLEIELVDVAEPPFEPSLANAVGFAEIRLGDVHVTETVRLPVDIGALGTGAEGHSLAIVMTRLRIDPVLVGRQDEERALVRRFDLPDSRAFELSGVAGVDPGAPDAVLDDLLGTTAPGTTYSASGHLTTDADARASRAFDGTAATAWSAPSGPQEGQWTEVELAAPVAVSQLQLGVVADGRRWVPTRAHLETEDGARHDLVIPAVGDVGPVPQTVTLPVDMAPARRLRVVIDAVRPPADPDAARDPDPVALAEVAIEGVPVAPSAGQISNRCRGDLLTLDGKAVPLRVTELPDDAQPNLALAACEGPVRVAQGSHEVAAVPGSIAGLDMDRVVLTSDSDGEAVGPRPMGATLADSGAQVRVVSSGPTSARLRVRT